MLNQITLQGRLARDPEVRVTNSHLTVTNFTLAVERDIPNKETGQKEVDFIDCVAWRQTAEFIAKYFVKGNLMAITGRLNIKNWTDKDGGKRRSAEVQIDHAYFCGSRNDSQSPGPVPSGYDTPQMGSFVTMDGEDENLPF